MSVAALLLVKDEADLIAYTVEHLLAQVDEVIVSDNASTDGTREILAELPVVLLDDHECGYFQSAKMSALGQVALERGHQWGVFGDADEWWATTDIDRPIRVFLNGLAPDIRVVTAELFNHIPTALDDEGEPNPFRRIAWRKREHSPLPKVCARLHPELVIAQGNHAAWLPGISPAVGGLVVRHYSWRGREQYIHKISVGAKAYSETDLPDTTGLHWRMFGLEPTDPIENEQWRERVGDHFSQWFFSADPWGDSSLILDPAPVA